VPAKTPADAKLPFQQLGHFQVVGANRLRRMGDVYKATILRWTAT